MEKRKKTPAPSVEGLFWSGLLKLVFFGLIGLLLLSFWTAQPAALITFIAIPTGFGLLLYGHHLFERYRGLRNRQ